MKIPERLRDPFGKERMRTEKMRAESIARQEIPLFLKEIVEAGLGRSITVPTLSFVTTEFDPLKDDGRRVPDTSYGSGELVLNWALLSPQFIFAKKHVDVLALAAIGHELGHYLQETLKTAVYKETFGVRHVDVDKAQEASLSGVAEDQCDYVSGIFIRHLANKGVIKIGQEETETLAREIQRIGVAEGRRSSAGHGSKSHRRELFMQGMSATNLEEEVRLVFGARSN